MLDFANAKVIMNVSSCTSSAVAAFGQSTSATQSTAPADDGSSPTSAVHGHRHGGGHVRHAVDDALQSVGLSLPTSSSASSTSTTGDSSTSATGDASGVKQDLQSFMHALFEAVKSESSGATATTASSTGSSSADPQSSFANGLSALISQVGSGSAPADLQSAFSKLASDLQASGGTTSASSATSGTSSDSSSAATLQAFLTHLQQDLGYGSGSASPAGSLVTTQV